VFSWFAFGSVFDVLQGSTIRARPRFQVYNYLNLYTNIETRCYYRVFHPGFIGMSRKLHHHHSDSCHVQRDQHVSGPTAANAHPDDRR
jgi:hypothetical protein